MEPWRAQMIDVARLQKEKAALEGYSGQKCAEVLDLRLQLCNAQDQLATFRRMRNHEHQNNLTRGASGPNGQLHLQIKAKDEQIVALKKELSDLQIKYASQEKRLKDSAALQLGYQRQMHEMNRALSKWEGVGRSNNWKLGASRDDDDDEELTETNGQRSSARMMPNGPDVPRPDTATGTRKRVRKHDEDDHQTITKRLRQTSLSQAPDVDTGLSVRPTRLARRQGEAERRKQDDALEKFEFSLVSGYGTNARDMSPGLSSKAIMKEMPEMWAKIEELIDQWEEDPLGQLWFMGTSFVGAKKRRCVRAAMAKRRMHWRDQDNGLFACKDCVRDKMPCFAYDPQDKRFKLLPMHFDDRHHLTKRTFDSQHWINA